MEAAMRIRLVVAATALAYGFCLVEAQPQKSTTSSSPVPHSMVTPEALKWQPLPRDWADGPPPSNQAKGAVGVSEVAIVQGDPTKEGEPFVIRIRSAPGTVLPPHWHPIDENITVLSGVFCVGTGDKVDGNGCADMPAGSYMVLPKGMHHYAVAKGDVVDPWHRSLQN